MRPEKKNEIIIDTSFDVIYPSYPTHPDIFFESRSDLEKGISQHSLEVFLYNRRPKLPQSALLQCSPYLFCASATTSKNLQYF